MRRILPWQANLIRFHICHSYCLIHISNKINTIICISCKPFVADNKFINRWWGPVKLKETAILWHTCVFVRKALAGATHNFHTPGAMGANLFFIIIYFPYIAPSTNTVNSMGRTSSCLSSLYLKERNDVQGNSEPHSGSQL